MVDTARQKGIYLLVGFLLTMVIANIYLYVTRPQAPASATIREQCGIASGFDLQGSEASHISEKCYKYIK